LPSQRIRTQWRVGDEGDTHGSAQGHEDSRRVNLSWPVPMGSVKFGSKRVSV
jgi:hypothetical protein